MKVNMCKRGDTMTDYRKYILSTGTHYISNSGSENTKT